MNKGSKRPFYGTGTKREMAMQHELAAGFVKKN